MSILRQIFYGSLVAAFLLTTAHLLFAPIQEETESPTPAPEQTVSPKRIKPSVESEESKPEKKKERTRVSTENPRPRTQPSKRFAGTWSGIVNVPNPLTGGGPCNCTYIVNDTEEWVKEKCSLFGGSISPATVSGNSISWKSGLLKIYANVLTVGGDGRTGRITINSSLGGGAGTVTRTGSPTPFQHQ